MSRVTKRDLRNGCRVPFCKCHVPLGLLAQLQSRQAGIDSFAHSLQLTEKGQLASRLSILPQNSPKNPGLNIG